MKAAWNYKALVFKLEYLFRIGVSPMAMADSFNGLNSNSFRWIKGFIGLSLYGAALVLLPKIGGDVIGAHLSTLLDPADFETSLKTYYGTLAEIIVIPFAELGALGAIKQLCKEVAA